MLLYSLQYQVRVCLPNGTPDVVCEAGVAALDAARLEEKIEAYIKQAVLSVVPPDGIERFDVKVSVHD